MPGKKNWFFADGYLPEKINNGDMEVLCSKAGGRYVSYPLSKLMPYTFNY